MNVAVTFYQLVLILIAAPLTAGLVKFFKARLQGRKGASPFQPYFTILTLLKKEMVISKSTSWVFRLAPFVVSGTMLFLSLVLPLVALGGILDSYSHFIIVAGMLMLGAVFLIFGGLESASAFGGMGSSREMTISSLSEPALLLIFASFAINSGHSEIAQMINDLPWWNQSFTVLGLVAFLLISLAENARYPVDNPATHLELTMVHEAMVLEYSGPLLAIMEYASFLKLTIFSALLVNLIYPMGLVTVGSGWLMIISAPLFLLLKIVLVTGALAILENIIVKMRFYRVHEFLGIAFVLAFASLFLSLVNVII